MAEYTLGVGAQPSIQNIITIGLKKVTSIEGAPPALRGYSGGLEIVATRESTEAKFERYVIRVSSDHAEIDQLVGAVEGLGDACAHTEEDGVHIFECPAPGSDDTDAGLKAVDTLSQQFKLPEIWHFEGADYPTEPLSIELLFKAMVQYKASDLHLSPGRKPTFRIDNQPRTADFMGPVSSDQVLGVVQRMAPQKVLKQFEEEMQCNFTYHQAGLGYGRVSAFVKMGMPHVTFRHMPEVIPSFEVLGVNPEMLERLASTQNGLVLISGMSGSGKSTTAAAIIEWINANRQAHILSIEDPIEYVFQPKNSFFSQRALGVDVRNFSEGAQGALRQDPDVIFIGEMRDADTIRAAIGAASSGMLVVSTLTSGNASGVVNRVASFFDPVERDMIRQQLHDFLVGVVCQKLIPKKGGGRVPALEIMYNDIKPISNAIMDGSTLGIRLGMQQNLSHSKLFEHYIYDLYKDEVITLETAKAMAPEISMFEQILMGTYSVPRIDR